MPFLRNTQTGTYVGPIRSDDPFYMDLRKARDANNRPLWEDQPDDKAAADLSGAFPQIADPSQVLALGAVVPALAAAAASELIQLGNMSRAGALVKAVYIPPAAVNGQAVNSRTLNVINGGPTGSGSTNMAALALVAGTNLAANVENVITLNGTQANLNANPGDEIQWQSALVGTGLADPGGIVVATFALTG